MTVGGRHQQVKGRGHFVLLVLRLKQRNETRVAILTPRLSEMSSDTLRLLHLFTDDTAL